MGRLALPVCWIVVFAACTPEHPTRLDLLTLLPFTGHVPPTEVIDLGAGDRRNLLRGWGDLVTLDDGSRGVAVREPVAAVAFEAGATPVDVEVAVGAERTFVSPPAPGLARRAPQAFPLGVEVNGARCRRARTRERGDLTFLVPAALQRPGRNVLTLRHPGGGPRADALGAPVITRLAFTRRLRPLQAEAVGNRLLLPAAASVTFYLRAPEGARLEFAAEENGGPVRAILLVDGVAPRALEPTAPGARTETALAVGAGELVGVRFEAAEPAVVVAPAVVGRARLVPTPAATSNPPAQHPNVLLYVMDTLRADRLGCYGYERDTSPRLDHFAAGAIVFRNAVAQAPWTRPSVASILTGQLPGAHGAVTLRDRLRGDIPTLAERLRAGGYETAGFVTNINVAAPFGFDRGFQRYEYLPEDPATPAIHVPAGRLHEAALAWLEARDDARPFFLYLHATDTHSPYRPEAVFLARFLDPPPAGAEVERLDQRRERAPERLSPDEVRMLSALYDAEIAQWDAAFGRLWEALRARGDDADTVVVFTADHGEEFHEHGGLEHGHTLYQEQVHVPLIVRLPGGQGGGQTVETLVRSVDLFPTLVELAGLAPAALVPGQPIASSSGPSAFLGPQEAIASTQFTRREVDAIVVPPWKIVFPPPGSARTVEVYDLGQDPAEERDVSADHPVLVGYARQQLAAQKALVPPATEAPGAAPVAPDVIERLRQLGYAVD